MRPRRPQEWRAVVPLHGAAFSFPIMARGRDRRNGLKDKMRTLFALRRLVYGRQAEIKPREPRAVAAQTEHPGATGRGVQEQRVILAVGKPGLVNAVLTGRL